VRGDYADLLPSALAYFEDDFEACIAHLRAPVAHRRATERRTCSSRPRSRGRRVIPTQLFQQICTLTVGWFRQSREFVEECSGGLGPDERAASVFWHRMYSEMVA
jgi:hypothetical protein